MTRLTIPLLLAAGLQGCIIYENSGDAPFEDGWWDDDNGDDWDDDDDNDDDDDDDIVIDELSLSPDHGAPGDTLLVSITGTEQTNLLDVTGVSFGSAIEVHDLIIDEIEILVVIEIAGDAAPGDVTVGIDLVNGQQATLAATFTIDEADAPSDTGEDTGGDTAEPCE